MENKTQERYLAEQMLVRNGHRILLAKIDQDTSETNSPTKGASALVHTLDERSGIWHEAGAYWYTMYYDMVDDLQALAYKIEDNDMAKKLGKQQTRAMAKRVIQNLYPLFMQNQSNYPSVTTCQYSDLDKSPFHIGAPNGVIDLRTGNLISPHEARQYLVSIEIKDEYNPEAKHVDAERLLAHLDPTTRKDILRQIAFSLFGRPSRRFGIWLGPPASGKSTLIEALKQSFGKYVGALDPKVIMPAGRDSNGGPSPETASIMPPVRLAFTDEMESMRIDNGKLKNIVGGTSIPYRLMYKGNIENTPSATPIIVGNKTPSLDYEDNATLDRLFASRWPAVVDVMPHMVAAFGEQATDGHAALRRQALVAIIVNECAMLSPDAPPPQSDQSKAFKNDLVTEEVDPLSETIKQIVIVGEPDDKLIVQDLYAAIEQRFKDTYSKKVVTDRTKKLFDLPPAKSRMKNRVRYHYWAGMKLVEPMFGQEFESEEEAYEEYLKHREDYD